MESDAVKIDAIYPVMVFHGKELVRKQALFPLVLTGGLSMISAPSLAADESRAWLADGADLQIGAGGLYASLPEVNTFGVEFEDARSTGSAMSMRRKSSTRSADRSPSIWACP